MTKTVYLLLADGQYLEGKGFGADLPQEGVIGEVVFTTGMTGYLETITDPSYYGQIVVQTFPLIGNYGVIPQDFESDKPYLSAYIVREWCQSPSNFRCQGDLDTFFKDQHIPAVYDIDTRKLAKDIRSQGVMNGLLTYEKLWENKDAEAEALKKIRAYHITNAVFETTRTMKTDYPVENAKYHVGIWDFGEKSNIVRELMKRGCHVTAIRPEASAEEIKALDLDGLMLSNGPGDPNDNPSIIKELQTIIQDKRLPIFGICLGHQLMALAHGARVTKLKYGHHGANQPVKDIQQDKIFMSSQNHNYAVDASTLPLGCRETFINLNDGSNEGVSYDGCCQATVQFHPEASAGPLDCQGLFDRFIAEVDRYKTEKGE